LEELESLQRQFNHFTDEGIRMVEKHTDAVFLISNNIQKINFIGEVLNRSLDAIGKELDTANATIHSLTLNGTKQDQSLSQLTSSIADLGARSSKIEVEIVQKITSVQNNTEEAVKTLEDKMMSALKDESERAIKREQQLQNRIEQESQMVLESIGEFSTQLATELKVIRSDQIDSIFSNLSSTVDRRVDEVNSKLNKIQEDLSQRILENLEFSHKNASDITIGVQEIIQAQFRLLEALELEVRSTLSEEASRASKAEAELMELIKSESSQSTTSIKEVRSTIEKEVARADQAVENLTELLAKYDGKLKTFEEDFSMQVNVESMRAKGTEAQLTSIIMSEVDRAKQSEEHLSTTIGSEASKLREELVGESNRAQVSEESLEKKISQEIERAIMTETNLLGNINEELKRASEKEELLREMLENVKTESLSLKDEFTKAIISAVGDTEAKISGHFIKIEEIEGRFHSVLNNEIVRAEKEENVLRDLMGGLGNRFSEFELGMLSTLMSEIEKAVGFKEELRANLTAEIDRAQRVEAELFQHQVGNWSSFESKFEDAFTLINNDTMTQVREQIHHATSTMTKELQTLSSGLDTKFANLTQDASKKFKKLEDDLKKCCSGSGWFRRPSFMGSSSSSSETGSGSTTGSNSTVGVLDRVMSLFGRRRVTTTKVNGTKRTSGSKASKTARRASVVAVGRKLGNALTFDNEKSFYDKNGGVEDIDGSETVRRKEMFENYDEEDDGALTTDDGETDEGSPAEGSSSSPVTVTVHRSNSKVRNTFG
jgi:hypothetical protein